MFILDSEAGKQIKTSFLLADIIYDKRDRYPTIQQWMVYNKKKQLFSSRYSNRVARLACMISFSYRPVILATYNSYRYRTSQLTGNNTWFNRNHTWGCAPWSRRKICPRINTLFKQLYFGVSTCQCWKFCPLIDSLTSILQDKAHDIFSSS